MTNYDKSYQLIQLNAGNLICKHGSVRAAARVLQIDAGYLCRLANGKARNPSDKVCKKLGLRKFVSYEESP